MCLEALYKLESRMQCAQTWRSYSGPSGVFSVNDAQSGPHSRSLFRKQMSPVMGGFSVCGGGAMYGTSLVVTWLSFLELDLLSGLQERLSNHLTAVRQVLTERLLIDGQDHKSPLDEYAT